ncbi:CLUMA_CG004093, isoform A [Clunio marinus]|uniref:CLUMA_CG004093, isoform A n=1 Tax=Clunio marinus TaxID=568069 RepID=A0A1J1HS37_9DIPT|nr:CLUMA_CG004093, isoform A [Clunio marinus]
MFEKVGRRYMWSHLSMLIELRHLNDKNFLLHEYNFTDKTNQANKLLETIDSMIRKDSKQKKIFRAIERKKTKIWRTSIFEISK